MSRDEFDVIVVGTGPAASTVATESNEAGHRVAVVEERDFGGTCALRGCNPKKVYTNAAAMIDAVRNMQGHGIDLQEARINWADLHEFKQQFTEPVRKKKRSSMEEDGIETIQATARFVDTDKIAAGDRELTAKRVVIATGARPAPLGIEGEEHVIVSDDFLELNRLPERVVFIGGGYVSMEFAHVAASYGSDVTVVERNEHILSGFDPDLIQQLSEHTADKGLRLEVNAQVQSVQQATDGFTLQYCRGDQSHEVACDLIVHGAGRIPNLESLDLDAGNVQSNKRGIEVDDFLCSVSNPNVFAAGDCTASGQPKLTPVANEEGRIVAENLFADSPQQRPDYGVVPRVAFTSPPIASVGLSEREAHEKHEVEVHREDTSSWGSVRKSGHRCAGYKVLVDKRSGRILGAHLLGPGADDIINLFAMAMKFQLTATDVKSVLIAFPTFASDVRKML